MRTKPGLNTMQVEKIATLLEASLTQRAVQVFLRQKNTDATAVTVSCTNSNRVERALRRLGEEDYDEGPAPSRDLIVKEGQIIEIKFRGNVHCTTADASMRFVFNTHIRCHSDFNVSEVDRFAQKGFETYRGFAQVFTLGMIPKPISAAEKGKSSKGGGAPRELVEGDMLLAELLIRIPKVIR
jgi:hypothetical protein